MIQKYFASISMFLFSALAWADSNEVQTVTTHEPNHGGEVAMTFGLAGFMLAGFLVLLFLALMTPLFLGWFRNRSAPSPTPTPSQRHA